SAAHQQADPLVAGVFFAPNRGSCTAANRNRYSIISSARTSRVDGTARQDKRSTCLSAWYRLGLRQCVHVDARTDLQLWPSLAQVRKQLIFRPVLARKIGYRAPFGWNKLTATADF